MNELTQYRNEIGKRLLEHLSHTEILIKLREEIINDENLWNSHRYEEYKESYEIALNEIEKESVTPNTSAGLIRVEQIFKKYNVPIPNKDNPLKPFPAPTPIDSNDITSKLTQSENSYNKFASEYILSNGWKSETINFLNEKFGIVEDCKIEAFIDHLIINGITSKKKIQNILNQKSLDELDELKDSLDIFNNRSLNEIDKIISRIETLAIQAEQNAKLEERLEHKEHALFKISELSQYCITPIQKQTFSEDDNKKRSFTNNFRAKFVRNCKDKNILVKNNNDPIKVSLINFIQILKLNFPSLVETFRSNWLEKFNDDPC